MEKLLEDWSFEAEETKCESVTIDAAYGRDRLGGLAGDADLSKYIL
jgi:ATP-dependent HslUV protease ATP-binding subunit HslU